MTEPIMIPGRPPKSTAVETDEGLRQMTERIYNVLFLCTGNSARSILAESLLSHWGKRKFRAYSAGSFPKGQVHPIAIELLQRMNLPAENLRSKSWDEFAAAGAPAIDFILTVCDNAAGEVCPIWPGKPMTAHWGIADPAAVEGTDADKAFAFRNALKELETRIKLFTSLPIASLDDMTLQSRLREIGKSSPATESA
jgi:arsenate reductase